MPDRPQIGVIGAFVEGWRRVLRAPLLWAVVLVVILPAASAAIWPADPSGRFPATSDITHDSAEAQRSQTFMLLSVGALPVVVQARTEYGGQPLDPTVATMTIAIYLFLWGGCLDRLARARPVGAGPFFAACGVYFWRFVRLCVPLGLAYWALWRWFADLHPAVSIVGLVIVNLAAGYAVVRMVVEDRRSAFGAIVASIRFVRRRPLSVLTLYALNIAAILAILALGSALTAWVSGVLPWKWARVIMQVELLAHLLGRLALAASAISFFQSHLAHAGYTAAPLPMWPDSPAAEAIENLVGQKAEDRGQKAEGKQA